LTVIGIIDPELGPGLAITNTATSTTSSVEEETGKNKSQALTRVGISHKIYLPVVLRGVFQ
jgi:hypothetical protein